VAGRSGKKLESKNWVNELNWKGSNTAGKKDSVEKKKKYGEKANQSKGVAKGGKKKNRSFRKSRKREALGGADYMKKGGGKGIAKKRGEEKKTREKRAKKTPPKKEV